MKIFLFYFEMAIKLLGRHKIIGSVGLAETHIFYRPYHHAITTAEILSLFAITPLSCFSSTMATRRPNGILGHKKITVNKCSNR